MKKTPSGPDEPNISNRDIWAQFKVDIAGKEVQTAETYSHSWVANQFGHVCLGIILASLLGVVLGSGISTVSDWLRLSSCWCLRFPWNTIVGCVVAAAAAALFEWRAYRIAARKATGQFPLGRDLLRENAFIATAYMVLGVALAFINSYFILTPGDWLNASRLKWGGAFFVGLVVIGIRLALPWLRQKIVWQKAGLPYLFRLADAPPTMDLDDAEKLNQMITGKLPPLAAPSAVIIGGPIGSGRTALCAGIGTEFAFRPATVRYLSMSTLLEFAARSHDADFFDDGGPANIVYWPWSRAQVVIIDDIAPLLAATDSQYQDQVAQLHQVLSHQLAPVREVLSRCHTVWIIGDPERGRSVAPNDQTLDRFAVEIRAFCTIPGGKTPNVLVAQLEHGAAQPGPRSPRVRARYLS